MTNYNQAYNQAEMYLRIVEAPSLRTNVTVNRKSFRVGDRFYIEGRASGGYPEAGLIRWEVGGSRVGPSVRPPKCLQSRTGTCPEVSTSLGLQITQVS